MSDAPALNDPTFEQYDPEDFYDEYLQADHICRSGVGPLVQKINSLRPGDLRQRQKSIERALMRMGITFTVYGDEQGTEKIFPFDLIPRIIEAAEWRRME